MHDTDISERERAEQKKLPFPLRGPYPALLNAMGY